MPADLIILGAGGHARVVIDALQRLETNVVGICDPTLPAGSPGPLGVLGLGGDEVLERYDPGRVQLVNGIGSAGEPSRRIAIFRHLTAKGWRFASVIHPSAVIGGDCRIGSGSHVMAGAILQAGTRIGENVIINTSASVDHDCLISDHVHIAPGATLCGGVTVGMGTHVGSGAVIIQGAAIGENALIGAGTVIKGTIGSNARVTATARLSGLIPTISNDEKKS